VLEVLYHHTKFGWARISPAAGAAKTVEFFCLSMSVNLSVTLLNDGSSFCVRFHHEAVLLEYRNGFDAVG